MRYVVIFLFLLFSLTSFSQKNIKVEMAESYELGNIVLALTKYGQSDPWDVQKIPPYYNEIISYFEPVKNHPLLDSVNYSRKDWEKFLGFRTDIYAFSFNNKGVLKRDYPFNSFGPKEVDKNLELLNDFVKQSNFRVFYKNHKEFYNQLVSNYKEYYFIDKSFAFLDKIAERPKTNINENYVIAISPLVGGQNCHRNTDSLTTVDFPNIGKDLILGKLNNNTTERVVDNHSIFTEMDHGYINPISDKYSKLISEDFDLKNWDKNSGYPGIASFNEYMTWAVYDLFIEENFPNEKIDSISTIYSKQNATRGFIAQNLFSKKLSELYKKSKSKKLESLYKPLLKWSKINQGKFLQPNILNADSENFQKIDPNNITLEFSEPMIKSRMIEFNLFEFENDKQTKASRKILIKDPQWSKDGKKVTFKLNTEYKEFAMRFHIWDSVNGLYSKNGILLNPENYILVK